MFLKIFNSLLSSTAGNAVSLKATPTPLYVEGVGDEIYIENISDPDSGESLIRYVQRKWLSRIIADNKPFKVECIFGEVKDLSAIKMILDDEQAYSLCSSVTLIFGDKIWNEERKIELESYLRRYQKFTAFKNSFRPENHGMMISNKIMLEAKHSLRETYKWVKVVDNASPDAQAKFEREFLTLYNNSIQITPENISRLELYN